MGKYQLAVAAGEREYAKRLADYVRDSPFSACFQVIAFTNSEACLKYLKQGYAIDFLAAEPVLMEELMEASAGIPKAVLVKELTGRGELPELLQFQPIPLLLQRLSELQTRGGVKSSGPAAPSVSGGGGGAKAAKVTAVYSASGGTGKTAIALHLAHAAGSGGLRVFYLNLELWNTSERWLGKPKREAGGGMAAGLSELLYELKAQPEQAAEWLLEHRIRHPLLKGDYVAPCTNMEDRLTLSPDDARGLIGAIARSGQYDLIVVDLDDGLGELHAAVFELSQQVLWVSDGEAAEAEKRMMKLRYGEQKWGERFRLISRKFLIVRNRTDAAAESRVRSRTEPSAVPVLFPDAEEWRAGEAGLLTSPLFRASAEKLANYLFQEGGAKGADR
ncbi:hypothetical protein KP806_20315 [Paenibacillus sp. N4]|uniref:hypothetical protein n=1 Tax=Paenibacillus vietnamensis TaxID=2590547 RepID=UPI001CD06F27|nr:hypothetical protein [Paenibacillus vietnamensis]MCA0757407.1 hypothetical protein [Paenibacillus vietnamensis]